MSQDIVNNISPMVNMWTLSSHLATFRTHTHKHIQVYAAWNPVTEMLIFCNMTFISPLRALTDIKGHLPKMAFFMTNESPFTTQNTLSSQVSKTQNSIISFGTTRSGLQISWWPLVESKDLEFSRSLCCHLMVVWTFAVHISCPYIMTVWFI